MNNYQLLSRWLQGQIPGKILPWQIDLDTTNICNQSCYYCNTEQFREELPVYQSVDSYMLLIQQLASWKKYDPNVVGHTNNIIFSGGGEPTLLPKYNLIVESAIDNGFLCAMNTNGAKLHKLLTIAPEKLKRFAYIGLDIDSGNPETYEKIRKSKNKISPFENVKRVATELGNIGAPIDVKALLMPDNTTESEINSLFSYAVDVKARSLHLRPVVLNDEAFVITQEVKELIQKTSVKYNIAYSLSTGRMEKRDYSKCHQFFLFPSFCADGNIYLCCEYKGRQDLKLGSWLDPNWRDLWCSDHHRKMYDNFRTHFCKPCRPNTTNNKIEFEIKNPNLVSSCFI
jgi:MoaA/NifB/PqqE/SkfB family radical SAM enzyme